MKDASLERNLGAWVATGLLSEEQATAIRVRETRLAADSESDRLPLYAQVLGYTGGAIALGLVFVVMTGHWAAIGLVGRLSLVGAIAAALLIGGVRAARGESASVGNLGEYLLFLGTISVGLLAGMTTGEFLPKDEYGMVSGATSAMPLVAGGGASFAVAVVVWLKRKSALPHVAMALALGTLALGLVSRYSSFDDPIAPLGTVFFALGLVWIVLAERGILRPVNEAWSMGSLAIGVGLFAEVARASGSGGEPAYGEMWFGLAVSMLLLLAGARLQRSTAIGFGSAGILSFVVSLLFAAPQTDSVQFASLAAIGVAVVGAAVALFVIRRKKARQRAEGDPYGIALLQVPESAEN